MNAAAAESRGRVLVVGAINVDLVVAAPRLPAPGETVVGEGVRRHGGGKGANAAVAAARAGADVTFVGALGVDSEAELAERELQRDGVDCERIQRLSDRPTGVALIVVDPDGENQIAVGAGANHALDPAHVAAAVQALAGTGLDCVLVSTEIPDDAIRAAVRAASRAGVTCVLNPAPPTAAVLELLALAPILTPNRGELRTLIGALADDRDRGGDSLRALAASGDPEAQAQALRAISGAPVCVTLGADGALLCDGDGCQRFAAGAALQVRDATGAGDTFNGVLAAWLAAAGSTADAVRAATVAGSLSVGAVGARAGMPTREAIGQALVAPETGPLARRER